MKVLAVIFGFIVLALIQVPKMVKNKWWKDLTVYSIVYLTALGTAVSYSLNWPIFSPVKALVVFMNGIYQMLGYQIPQ